MAILNTPGADQDPEAGTSSSPSAAGAGEPDSTDLSSHVDEDPTDGVIGTDPDVAVTESAGASPA